MIEGISQERGKKLKETDIITIKDLAFADAETVGELEEARQKNSFPR